MHANEIAEWLLGSVDWIAPDTGYCACPGIDLHTNRNGYRDCRVMVNGAPTIHCVHSSCREAIAEANRKLRSEMGKAEAGRQGQIGPRKPTAAEIERRKSQAAMRSLEERSRKSLTRIIEDNRMPVADLYESSPVRLVNGPNDDWHLLLRLFPADGVVWIGDTKDSCDDAADSARKAYCRTHFRAAGEWMAEKRVPGQFTCPSLFREGVHSRSNTNVVGRPFLVVESDTLGKQEVLAVFTWMRRFMRLRAVVDTGGKSLHGWFEYPTEKALAELRVILPGLQCDAALFNASQPCRLPGAKRGVKTQCLLWLDLEKRA